MTIDLDDVIVINNEAEQRYEATVVGQLAVLTYHLAGMRMTLIHTGVPAEERALLAR